MLKYVSNVHEIWWWINTYLVVHCSACMSWEIDCIYICLANFQWNKNNNEPYIKYFLNCHYPYKNNNEPLKHMHLNKLRHIEVHYSIYTSHKIICMCIIDSHTCALAIYKATLLLLLHKVLTGLLLCVQNNNEPSTYMNESTLPRCLKDIQWLLQFILWNHDENGRLMVYHWLGQHNVHSQHAILKFSKSNGNYFWNDFPSTASQIFNNDLKYVWRKQMMSWWNDFLQASISSQYSLNPL